MPDYEGRAVRAEWRENVLFLPPRALEDGQSSLLSSTPACFSWLDVAVLEAGTVSPYVLVGASKNGLQGNNSK